MSMNYGLPSNQNLSSEIKPPAGSEFTEVVVGSALTTLVDFVDVENVKEKVITAEIAIRIINLVFMMQIVSELSVRNLCQLMDYHRRLIRLKE